MTYLERITQSNTVVWVDNEEDDKLFTDWLHGNGKKWNTGKTYNENKEWNLYEEDTCYMVGKGTFCYKKHFADKGYTITKFNRSDIGMFTKKDLRSGDFVVTSVGKAGIVINGAICYQRDGFDLISQMQDGLTWKDDDNAIEKVFRPTVERHYSFDTYQKAPCIYDRSESAIIMTIAEIEKKLGHKVKIISEDGKNG